MRDDQIKNKLFYDNVDGLECEVLRLGAQSWQKGKIKVKVTVEFCPDEPEETEESETENETEVSDNNNSENLEAEVSPLDDLLQKFSQEN
ncbi:MAG: KGK domain-containing protein [Microcoleaceae cyanobacterium]